MRTYSRKRPVNNGPFYALKNGDPTPCRWIEWAINLGKAHRIVAQWSVRGAEVLTSFYGCDESCGKAKRPKLWRTRVIGGRMSGTVVDYASVDDARAGHEAMIKKLLRRTENGARS